MKFDLHVHSNCSIDGFSSPDMIIRSAIKRGLSGIAVTDHNTGAGVLTVSLKAPEGFIVIPGVEYSTDYGHILALFTSLDMAAFDKCTWAVGTVLTSVLLPLLA